MFFIISAGGLTILMTIVLTIRQTFFGIRPDKRSSYPTPPRALITPFKVSAIPVFGHTPFFRLDGGRLYHRFSKTWTEYGRFIPCHGRKLGSCFAIFIWGQWRVVVIGKRRARVFFDTIVRRTAVVEGDDEDGNRDGNVDDTLLKPAWAFFAPRPLLGSNCPAMMNNLEERRVLVNLFREVLSHEKCVRFSEKFGVLANGFVDQLLEGKLESTLGGRGDSAFKCLKRRKLMSAVHPQKCLDGTEAGNMEVDTFHIGSHTLRHFSFDLINGPLLGLEIVPDEPEQQYDQQEEEKGEKEEEGEQRRGYIGKLQRGSLASGIGDISTATSKEIFEEEICGTGEGDPDETGPSREKILTWMRRIQKGLLGFRFTVGGKWMQIWRLNEYGRAIHARNDIMNTLLSDHISKKSELSQTIRPVGINTIDPLITPNPIYTFATQIEHHIAYNTNEKMKRRNSAPSERGSFIGSDSLSIESDTFSTLPSLKTVVTPIHDTDLNSNEDVHDPGKVPDGVETPLAGGMSSPHRGGTVPGTVSGIGIKNHKLPGIAFSQSVIMPSSRRPEKVRARARSDTELYIKTDLLALFKEQEEQAKKRNRQGHQDGKLRKSNCIDKEDDRETSVKFDWNDWKPPNLLDDLLAQEDEDGNGISQAAVTDISFLLWMSLDAGSAWTSMALQLLQHDPNALQTVRNELNHISCLHGAELFAHLDEAKYLDAAVYEAVRLCPPFCGGMWTTRRTVELQEDGLQVPAGTNVIFAGVTTRPFDLEHAWGKKAQDLVHDYPARQLYGFLPLNGNEIPLMVLQSKILLAAILHRCNICPQDVEKRKLNNVKEQIRRTKEGYYVHFSDNKDDDKMTRMEDCTSKFTKNTPQRKKNESSDKVDEGKEIGKGEEEPFEYMGGTCSGASAQMKLAPTLSNQQSDLSFSSHSNSSREMEAGAIIPVETLLNPSVSSNIDDEYSTSTSDSTALQLRSFEYPYGDGFSEFEQDLSFGGANSENSTPTPSASPYTKRTTQQNSAQHALTPDECESWFTKLPFPESINSVSVTARYMGNEI